MRIAPHHHRCQVCLTKTECCGQLEENWDGDPPFICLDYHKPNGQIAEFYCSGCACVDCDEMSTTERKTYTGPDTYVMEKVCKLCAEKRDNYEPPETTFDEALGARCDVEMRLDEARRLK